MKGKFIINEIKLDKFNPYFTPCINFNRLIFFVYGINFSTVSQ